jgi:hypothetical protein
MSAVGAVELSVVELAEIVVVLDVTASAVELFVDELNAVVRV